MMIDHLLPGEPMINLALVQSRLVTVRTQRSLRRRLVESFDVEHCYECGRRRLRFWGWEQLLRPTERKIAKHEVAHTSGQAVHKDGRIEVDPLPEFRIGDGWVPGGQVHSVRVYDQDWKLMVEVPVTITQPLQAGDVMAFYQFDLTIT